ncbi:MAG: hypothetical protein VYD01_00225 [Pseudomonadota bacterium]|nr:hypothetical protein [Pseudomonadota bacterium]
MQIFRFLPVLVSTVVFIACTDGGPSSAVEGSIDDHVTFYGAGRVARYQQNMDSSLKNLGPVFFSEIFIRAGGEVSEASVRFPNGETRVLEYRYSDSMEIGDVMYLSGVADSNEAMEAEFPTGAYAFTFSTPAGFVVDSVVSFEGGSFPAQPLIIFEQGGERIAFDVVDPDSDLTISWPPFTEGDSDPNGILDDLVFVAIDSCTVEDIVHSGRPFEKDDYLIYSAERYIVPGGMLMPGQTYSMYVEHALLPHTQQDYGMPAFATFAASTYLDFRTTGKTDPLFCDTVLE